MSDAATTTTNDVAVPTSADTEPTREQLIAMLTTDPDETSSESAADTDPAEAGKHGASTSSAADSDEAKKDPKAERIAARIAATVKTERRVAAEQAKIRAQAADVEKRAAELERREARLRLIEEDPVKAFEELKLDPKTFLEKLSGTHKPESIAERRLAELEKQVVAERTARERLLHQQQLQHVEQTMRQETHAFVQMVASSEAFPTLVSEFTPEEIAQQANAVAQAHGEAYKREHGEYPSNEVIAQYLEDQAKARAQRRTSWRQPAQPSQGKPGSQIAQSVTSKEPRTLTNGSASQRASVSKPWSQKDADEESLRLIQQMHASRD